MKSRLHLGLRLLFSAVLLAALLAFIPLAQLWDSIRAVPLGLWLSALTGFLAGHLVAAFKWWLLTSPDSMNLRQACQAHFAGLAANLVLPGAAGGDLVRAVAAMRHADRRTAIGVACAADRLVDCTALLILAGAGACWTAQLSGLVGHALLTSAVVLALIASTAAVCWWRWRRKDGGWITARIAESLGDLACRPLTLLSCLSLSMFVQGSFLGLNLWLGQAAGVESPAGAWLVAWPLAKLAACLPLTIAGLGLREAALVALLRPFGAAPPTVIAAGLLWQTVVMAGGLVGSIAVVVPGTIARSAPADPAIS